MHYRWSVIICGVLLAHCGIDPARLVRQVESQVVRLATPADHSQHLVVASSYIVAFRGLPGSTTRHFASFTAEYAQHYGFLADQVLADPRLRELHYITAVDLAKPGQPKRQEDIGKAPAALQFAWGRAQFAEQPAVLSAVTFESPAAAAAVLREWEADGTIWFAEPNYLNRVQDASPISADLLKSYNTAGSGTGIWWHKSIKLPKALAQLSSATFTVTQTPVVAVLDSGLDIEHPQLKNHLWVNPSPGASGCSGDVNGCNTTAGQLGGLGDGDIHPFGATGYSASCDNIPCDDAKCEARSVCGHGTHVAGIIAADFDSSLAAAGVCPLCRIMAIKVIAENGPSKGLASDQAILLGFKYLTRFRDAQGGVVRVANSSLGKYAHSRATELVIGVLKEAPNEILVVAAASNDDSMIRSYPAAFGSAIAVAAVGPNDEKAIYSNFGPWVTVSAPGGNGLNSASEQINSTVPGGGLGVKQGTSMASPVVAGIAGLILAYDPARGYQALRDSIVNTADPRLYAPGVNSGINLNYYNPKLSGSDTRIQLMGSGIVDVAAALTSTVATATTVASSRVSPGCGVVAGGPAAWGGSWWWLWLPLAALVLL